MRGLVREKLSPGVLVTWKGGLGKIFFKKNFLKLFLRLRKQDKRELWGFFSFFSVEGQSIILFLPALLVLNPT